MASTRSLGILRTRMQVGDLILCWQTDRKVAVGLCRVFELPKCIDQDGTVQVEMVLKLIGQPFDPTVPLLTIKKTDPRIEAVRAFQPGFAATLYETTPQEATDLLKVCGVSRDELKDPVDHSPKGGKKSGGGFGNADENRKVELAAEKIVSDTYSANGWKVKPVQYEGRGYDLECVKGRVHRHVEVKGVRGSASTFPITRNEVNVAKCDPRWRIAVVTDALGKPQLREWTASAFLSDFDLKVISFMACAIQAGS